MYRYLVNITYFTSDLLLRKIAPTNWPEKTLFPASCNGWLYVVTPKIIERLLDGTKTAPFVFMEDT